MFTNLKLAETRYHDAARYHPNSSETVRRKMVFDDMHSKLTVEEAAEYEAFTKPVLNIHEQRALLEEELRLMEQNRDSESI